MSAIGYVTLVKRENRTGDGYDYQPAGSMWPDIEPVENHRVFCEMTAEAHLERYGEVEYVIGKVLIEECQTCYGEGHYDDGDQEVECGECEGSGEDVLMPQSKGEGDNQ